MHLGVHVGKPNPVKINSNKNGRHQNNYNISWSVDSYTPIEEFKLFYRKVPLPDESPADTRTQYQWPKKPPTRNVRETILTIISLMTCNLKSKSSTTRIKIVFVRRPYFNNRTRWDIISGQRGIRKQSDLRLQQHAERMERCDPSSRSQRTIHSPHVIQHPRIGHRF